MDNKSKILEISLRLFATYGYDKVGVQEIVDSAEITKPTLYHYFGSKKGLFDALLEKYFTILISDLQNTTNYNGDLPKTLTDIVNVFFPFAIHYKLFYRLQLTLCFAPPESESYKSVEIYNKKILSMFESMFQKAVQDHGNIKGREKRYAFTFLGIINNYITLFLSNNLKLDAESVNNAVHQFSHGIYS